MNNSSQYGMWHGSAAATAGISHGRQPKRRRSSVVVVVVEGSVWSVDKDTLFYS